MTSTELPPIQRHAVRAQRQDERAFDAASHTTTALKRLAARMSATKASEEFVYVGSVTAAHGLQHDLGRAARKA